MNKLPVAKRVQILSMLVEGSSLRSTSRVCGVSINTVTKLLVDAGTVCAAFHDASVRKVNSQRIQCDEIWSFCYAKAKNVHGAKAAPEGAGDVWTFTALDANTKMIVSWLVGSRDGDTAYTFLCDLKDRITQRVQLTTDGFNGYRSAVGGSFGVDAVDYAMLVKLYSNTGSPNASAERRYSPSTCTGAIKTEVFGTPDPKHINTSFVERQNLTMRMSMRRFTRLTNAFSKKFENHCHSLALYFVWYNWMRKHKTLGTTPAVAAGLTDETLDMTNVVTLMDKRDEQLLADKRRANFEMKEAARARLHSHSNWDTTRL
ncbi:MAG: Transposase [Bradyrhizobium sp.]|nr:Transposase [Bradyrhizobium sp.]